MKIKKYLVIPAACLALSFGMMSCGEGDGDIQWWDWSQNNPQPEPEPEPEPTPEPDRYVETLGCIDVKATYEGLTSALPEYMNLYTYQKEFEGKEIKAFIAVADMDKATFSVLGEATGYNTPSELYAAENHAIIINGGFFWDGSSLSLIQRGGELVCPNVQVDSPDWTDTWYYMPRGTFAQKEDGTYFTGWTYTSLSNQTFWYPTSMPLENGRVPDMTYPEGAQEFVAETAIGGGPVLVLDSKVVNTHENEYLLINPTDNRPRTAIGIDAENNKIIYFVCEGDGMTAGIDGMTLEDVANFMIYLGCNEALNLDGGGSSCMLVNGEETIKPSDGKQRSVVSAVALD